MDYKLFKDKLLQKRFFAIIVLLLSISIKLLVMTTAQCPLCHSDVIIEDDVYENDLVTCVNCGNDLEITSLTPLELRAIEEE